MSRPILVLLFFFGRLSCFGQVEFFIKLDPKNANWKKIDSIPSVKWIKSRAYNTYNPIDQTFIFKGANTQFDWTVYILDAHNGQVLFEFPYSVESGDVYKHLKYNEKSDNLCALLWDNSEQKEYLVSIDYRTGLFLTMTEIPGVQGIRQATFDQNNERFIFEGSDSSNYKLYSIHASSGTILSNPVIPNPLDTPNQLYGMEYNNENDLLYSILTIDSTGQKQFGTVNLQTGKFSKISVLNGVRSFRSGQHSLNEASSQYCFTGVDSSEQVRLFCIDIKSGKLLTSPIHPKVPEEDDNIILYNFDRLSGELYGLHWDANFIDTYEPFVYPNPTNNILQVEFLLNREEISAELYDSHGNLVVKNEMIFGKRMILDLSSFAKGIYNLKIQYKDLVTSRKIVLI